jgi:hypothetical protein
MSSCGLDLGIPLQKFGVPVFSQRLGDSVVFKDPLSVMLEMGKGWWVAKGALSNGPFG